MSINPPDPSLIHIRSQPGGYELLGSSTSTLGSAKYIHADDPQARTLPIGWVKVKTIKRQNNYILIII